MDGKIWLEDPAAQDKDKEASAALERGVLAALAADPSLRPRLTRQTRLTHVVFRAERTTAQHLLEALQHGDPLPPLPPDWRPAADPERDYMALLAAFQRAAAAAALAKAGEALARDGLPASALDALRETLRQSGALAVPPPPPPEAVDIAQALREWPALPPDILPGLAPGEVGEVVAPGGTGKSYMLLQTAVSVAAGLPPFRSWPLAQESEPGRVLYVGAEDGADWLHYRLRAIADVWSGHPDMPPDWRERVVQNLEVLSYAGQADTLAIRVNRKGSHEVEVYPTALYEYVESQASGCKLLIIDPLRRFHDTDENDSSQATKLVQHLEALAQKTGATVIVAHHTNKSSMLSGSGDEQHAGRGSSALVDGFRWALHMQTMTKDDCARTYDVHPTERRDYVKLTLAKTNHGKPLPDLWYRRGFCGVLEPTEEPPRKEGKNGKASQGDECDIPMPPDWPHQHDALPR